MIVWRIDAEDEIEHSHRGDVHVLDAGHFALDTKAGEIAALVSEFMKTQK